MPFATQRRLLDGIRRTARDGAIVLVRSVDADDIPAKHDLAHVFRRMDAASDQATTDDRSRQYRRVDFYQVCH
jgi:hypothetical protein